MITAIDIGSTKVGALTHLSELEFEYNRFQHDFGAWVAESPEDLQHFKDARAFGLFLSQLKKLQRKLDNTNHAAATAAFRYLPQGALQKILWRECGLFPITISIEHEGELLTRAIKSKLSKASNLIGTRFIHLHVGGLSTEITLDIDEYASPIQLGFEHFGFSDPNLKISGEKDIDKVKNELTTLLERDIKVGTLSILMRDLPSHTKLVVSGRFARQILRDSKLKGFELSSDGLRALNLKYSNELKDRDAASKLLLTMFLIELLDLSKIDSVIVSDARMAMGQVAIVEDSMTRSKIQSEMLRRGFFEFQNSLPYPELTSEKLNIVSALNSASSKKTVPLIATLELLRTLNEPYFTSRIEDLFIRNHMPGLSRETQLRIAYGMKGIEGGSNTARILSKLVRLIISEGARVYTDDNELVISAERVKIFPKKEFVGLFDKRKLVIKKA